MIHAGLKIQKAAITPVVDHGVVDQIKLMGSWVSQPFEAKADQVGVGCHGALLNDVSDKVSLPSVGEIQASAGRPGGFVREPIVLNDVHLSPAFQFVSGIGMVRIIESENQGVDMVDIQIVRKSIPKSVQAKFKIL